MREFPKNFLFGSATSAHQIEGGLNNDWSKWEKIPGNIKDGSNSQVACDSWNCWWEDLKLLKKTGQNAYRFSIEWSRIEPQKGEFDEKAVLRYREILKGLKSSGIKSMVTLFHFTLPLWISGTGGFENRKNTYYFVRFCRKIASELGDLIDLWSVLNEPNVYVLMGYFRNDWCPAKKSYFLGFKTFFNLIAAHNRAYRAIKKIVPKSQIGIALNMASYVPIGKNWLDRTVSWWAREAGHRFFLRRIKKNLDFLGINHYMKFQLRWKKPRLVAVLDALSSDFGWHITPTGIYDVITENRHYKLPIYITENGIADEKDRLRPDFIRDYLRQVARAIGDGADVRGYFHWSLLDNFEWAEGYKMKFGLFTIDRKPRASASVYQRIIETNSID